MMPEGVEKVRLRTDTAGYEVKLLKYCAEGKHERFSVFEFAIGVDVTNEFKEAVAEVREEDWQPIIRRDGGVETKTGQECAEVCHVPNWAGRSKNGPTYRFIAIREPLRQRELPGMETERQLPFPTMDFADKGRHKVFGIVTNRDLPTDELVWWHRGRCGKSEEVHAVMKDDLAGGQLPSGDFGENAAWWAIMILSLNLNVILRRLVLGGSWAQRRIKALRIRLLNIAGRVVRHARRLAVKLVQGHPAHPVLVAARERMLQMATGPPG